MDRKEFSQQQRENLDKKIEQLWPQLTPGLKRYVHNKVVEILKRYKAGEQVMWLSNKPFPPNPEVKDESFKVGTTWIYLTVLLD